MHWVLVLFYTALTVLVCVNMFEILYRQGRWRSIPVLLFYIWSFIAILTREIMSCFGLPMGVGTLVINSVQPYKSVEQIDDQEAINRLKLLKAISAVTFR